MPHFILVTQHPKPKILGEGSLSIGKSGDADSRILASMVRVKLELDDELEPPLAKRVELVSTSACAVARQARRTSTEIINPQKNQTSRD